MAHYLPPVLLALFTPRPPLKALPQDVQDEAPLKDHPPYSGMAQYLTYFKDPQDLKELKVYPTSAKIRERRVQKAAEKNMRKIENQLKEWKPKENPNATSDPSCTLFVGRLDFDVGEEMLKSEMKRFGAVQSLIIVRDKEGKSRGYAFVEFETPKDVQYAMRYASGKRIGNRRIVVDVERGRTISSWKPRRLGGGIGDTRKNKLPKKEIEWRQKFEDYKRRKQEEETKTQNSGRGQRQRRGRRDDHGRRGRDGHRGGRRDGRRRNDFRDNRRDYRRNDRGNYDNRSRHFRDDRDSYRQPRRDRNYGDRGNFRGNYGRGGDYDRGDYDRRRRNDDYYPPRDRGHKRSTRDFAKEEYGYTGESERPTSRRRY